MKKSNHGPTTETRSQYVSPKEAAKHIKMKKSKNNK